MAHAGVWLLTGSTFLLSFYALVDQGALRRDLSAQVFRVVDGVATVAPNVQRVILAPKKPSDAIINALPAGSVYVGAKLQFATGHVLEEDTRGNLVLLSVTDGVETRMATFSPHGAVGFGQMPLSPRQETQRNLFLTGSPSDTVRDGWQSNGTTFVTDGGGRTVGSISNVYFLGDPSRTGLQMFSDDARQAVTFTSSGQVLIGHVSQAMMSNNKQASLLVGGDVVVDASARTINYKCMDIETFAPGGSQRPLLGVSLLTGQEFSRFENGIEARFQNPAYFQINKCYLAANLPFLRAVPDYTHQSSVYVKTLATTCVDGQTKVQLNMYATAECNSENGGGHEIDLNRAYEMPDSAVYYVFRCWLPSATDVADVEHQFNPT